MRTAVRSLGVWALFAALTIALVYPLSVSPATRVTYIDADVDLFMWTLAWNTHALFTRPLELFHSNIYYPQPWTLAYSENLLGSTPFAAPVLWLTGNPMLAMNVVALTSVLLCGIGAYVLARRLGVGVAASIVCGVIFAFSPSRFYRFGQIHLTTVQWIPFTLAYLHAYLANRRRRDLWLATGFFTWQVLATGHGAVFVVLAVLIVLLFHYALGPKRLRIGGGLRDFGWPGALLLLPSLLLFVPYLIVQREMGLRRSLENWAPAPGSWLATPAHLPLRINTALAGMDVNANATAFMFPGYLPILLAIVALVLAWRAFGRPMAPHAAITVVSLLLAAGPPLSLWPHVYWLPGFNFVRGPTRFVILATLGIAVLAAFGFEMLARRLAAPKARAAAALTVVWLVVEFATVPFTGREYELDVPRIDKWLATQPKPFVVAEVPVGGADLWHSRYMLHTLPHWQKTVHGHSGIRAPLHDELYGQLREFPDEEGVANLERLGVTHLVVHTERYPAGEWEKVEERLRSFAGRLDLLHVQGEGRVYAVRRALAVSPRGAAAR